MWRFWEAWSIHAREWRHNRCIMTPLTAITLLFMGLFWLVVLVLKFPTLLLGLLLSPCMHRMQFVIQFLYPTALGRFVHLTLCRMVMRSKLTSFSGGDDKNHGSHSRTLETRIEVIPGRVYIHPLPQLLDNLGYLVVCCPPPETRSTSDRSHRNDGNNSQQHQLLHNNNNLSSSGTSGCCDDEGFEEEMNVGQSASSDTAASSNNNNNNYIVNNNSVVSMTSLGKITIAPQKAKNEEEAPRIVAFIVDCGDAHAVQQQLQLIQSRHYDNEMIYVQAILSTHKHHDHTAGNVPFLQLPFYGRHLKLIMGGAVERVPGCNYAVKNGQAIPLPKFGANIMQDVLHVEAVATPGHTRGSLTYILRPNPNTSNSNIDSAAAGTAASTAAANNADHHPCCYYLFTGDTVFSGGGGVPFEADLDPGQDENEAKQTFTSFVHASAAGHAVERCFAEVLARILPVDAAAAPPISTLSTMSSSSSRSRSMPIMADFAALAKRSFILPGHEYTQELLGRQLRPQGGGGGTGSDGSGGGDAYKWKNFPPSYFFETASHFYTAMHRRGLPQSNGKLVTAIGAPLQRELHINPVFRTLKRRAEVLVPAILAWNKRFARNKVTSQSIRAVTAAAALLDNDDEAQEEEGDGSTTDDDYLRSNKTSSTEDCWNLNSADLSRSVFCTVYTSDMDMLMADLTQNRISTAMAARRLKQMQQRLDEPLISRRPLPGTLPSDRAVYRGLLALALLGSSPTAMTLSDSRRMNLPKPIVKSSDLILVSRKRLISVLSWLGLIPNDIEGRKLVAMIHQLWKEACEDATAASCTIKPSNAAAATVDAEAGYSIDTFPDLTELGNLKWTLYGVPRQQKSSVLFCLPCCSSRPERMDPEHAVSASGLRPHSGELVRHDVLTCPLCIDLTGGGGAASASCPHATPSLSVTTSSLQDNMVTMNGGSSSRNIRNRHNSSSSRQNGMNTLMRDDSASSSSNYNDNLMTRTRPSSVLTRHDTNNSEGADDGNGVFGSMLLEV